MRSVEAEASPASSTLASARGSTATRTVTRELLENLSAFVTRFCTMSAISTGSPSTSGGSAAAAAASSAHTRSAPPHLAMRHICSTPRTVSTSEKARRVTVSSPRSRRRSSSTLLARPDSMSHDVRTASARNAASASALTHARLRSSDAAEMTLVALQRRSNDVLSSRSFRCRSCTRAPIASCAPRERVTRPAAYACVRQMRCVARTRVMP